MKEITKLTEQYVDNLEHDETYRLKKVMPYGYDGTNAVALKVASDGSLITSGMVSVSYDSIALVQAALTDTWTYKSGVTTVATVTVTYTDATKVTISTVVRT
jgi:tRNA(Ile2) C34 agmatinyltransferase TiaS